MRTLRMLVVTTGMVLVAMTGAPPDAPRLAQAQSGTEKATLPDQTMPGKSVAGAVRVRGSIQAIDKEKGTVTLKGPRGRTLTLEVRDKQKLDAVQVGDPVIATYVEAVAFQVHKAGTAMPGMSTQESRVSSKPGETPAGAIGQTVTITATITAIDRKAHTVTIKGPQGETETIKSKDPKNLEGVTVGDLVEITYTRALAVALDRPAK